MFQFCRDILSQSCFHGVQRTASQTVFIVNQQVFFHDRWFDLIVPFKATRDKRFQFWLLAVQFDWGKLKKNLKILQPTLKFFISGPDCFKSCKKSCDALLLIKHVYKINKTAKIFTLLIFSWAAQDRWPLGAHMVYLFSVLLKHK